MAAAFKLLLLVMGGISAVAIFSLLLPWANTRDKAKPTEAPQPVPEIVPEPKQEVTNEATPEASPTIVQNITINVNTESKHKQKINCTYCNGIIDIEKDSVCPHCGAPIDLNKEIK